PHPTADPRPRDERRMAGDPGRGPLAARMVSRPRCEGAAQSKYGGLGDTRMMKLLYAGIRVRDLETSIRFYRKVMGMKISRRGTMSHGGVWVELQSAGSPQRLELNWYPPGSKFHTPYRRGEELDHLAFRVTHVAVRMEDARAERPADVDALLDRSRPEERGGDSGRHRTDDPGLVETVPRLDLSAPGGAAARGARPEAGRRAV